MPAAPSIEEAAIDAARELIDKGLSLLAMEARFYDMLLNVDCALPGVAEPLAMAYQNFRDQVDAGRRKGLAAVKGLRDPRGLVDKAIRGKLMTDAEEAELARILAAAALDSQ